MLVAAVAAWCATWAMSCASSPRAAKGGPDAAPMEDGVEVEWWVVDDAGPPGGQPLRTVLAGLEGRPAPIDAGVLGVWRANGLRVVALMPEAVEGVRARMNVVGPVQRERLGDGSRWQDVARVAVPRGGMTVGLDNGPVTIRDGRVMLSLRAWGMPDPEGREDESGHPRAVVVVEAVPRHVSGWQGETGGVTLGGPAIPSRETLVFDRLWMTAVVGEGMALLVIPESPGEEWGVEARRRADTVVPHIGPEAPPMVTLGEALMRSEGETVGRSRRQVVVVRVKPPGRFELMGEGR
ncbi:MAG: hypothetical protein HBSAPP03_07260 [Phycisphaerae bacterium]|nr:MAG: hypothetical protein HBSAPP03_07260 [Phycisphaerae bacterium]